MFFLFLMVIKYCIAKPFFLLIKTILKYIHIYQVYRSKIPAGDLVLHGWAPIMVPSAKCPVVAKPIVADNWKSYKAQKEARSQKYLQKKMFKTRQVTIFILSVTFLTILRFGATLCISKLTSYHPPILCEVLICSSIILYPCSKSFTQKCLLKICITLTVHC